MHTDSQHHIIMRNSYSKVDDIYISVYYV